MKDKATVEMECMEEGYLAKIIRGDGEKEIKVGEVWICSSSLSPLLFFCPCRGIFIWYSVVLRKKLFSPYTPNLIVI